ncbi:hypothetical protein L1987_87573 [Smallanthus sonchifolius]|nr:hypothetical protein L1987_87573 [Smallanthus sonchifolius]
MTSWRKVPHSSSKTDSCWCKCLCIDYMTMHVFASLLLRRECCSYSNGEYVRSGLAILECWCHKATEEALKMVMEKESWFMMPLETIQTVSFAGLVGDGAVLISQTAGLETAPQPSVERKIDIII